MTLIRPEIDYRGKSPEELFERQLRLRPSLVHTVQQLVGRYAGAPLLSVADEARDVLDEPAIIAPWHQDFFDIPFTSLAVRSLTARPTRFVAMVELFGAPEGASFVRRAAAQFSARGVAALGGIPLDRQRAQTGDPAETMQLLRCVRHAVNKRRENVVVYPHGGWTTAADAPINEGALVMSRLSRSPIVAVGIAGTAGLAHSPASLRQRHIAVRFHSVLHPEDKPSVDDLARALSDAQDAAEQLKASIQPVRG